MRQAIDKWAKADALYHAGHSQAMTNDGLFDIHAPIMRRCEVGGKMTEIMDQASNVTPWGLHKT